VGGQPGNWQNGTVPVEGRQRPDGVKPFNADLERPDRAGPNGQPEKMPGGGMDDRFGSRMQNISIQQMYLIGGTMLLLVVVLVMILRKRTKYSI
jgi:hypothetical protein